MKKRLIHKRHIYILASILSLVLLFLLANFLLERSFIRQPITFGVSYAPFFAREIGLNPREVYLDMLNNNVKNIRLNAYWDEIEPEMDVFNFDDLDWYINQAESRKATIILTVGFKLPRWPECRAPEWANSDLIFLRQRQLIMVEKVIQYYNQNPTISAFQIENEPLLSFGICPPPDPEFFQKEMQLVRNLTQKPILITDSGELSTWITPMQSSDIFGTTMYRKVSNILGDIFYPLPPWWYRVKSDLVRKIFAPENSETIVAELQAELWAGAPLSEISIENQVNKFPLHQLESNVAYAKRTGFKSFYLWGAEWWYYLAENGHPEYLEYAKTLF